MNLLLKSTLGTGAIAAGMLLTQPASAIKANRSLYDQGGPACQLSVPTTASKVRPRANGLRNEGTSSEFVICQYQANSSEPFYMIEIAVSSFDGKDHVVSCTAVNGNTSVGIYYSSKNVSTGTSTRSNSAFWVPADLDQGGSDFYNMMISVTCALPPGAVIQFVGGFYKEDIGA